MEASSSSVNGPHVNDPDPDDFFGSEEGGDGGAEAAAADDAAQAEAEREQPVSEESHEGERPDPDEQPATPPQDAHAAETPQPAKKERPYVVLREIELNKDALDRLLEHAAGGGAPMKVFAEVETIEARNDQHALRSVYQKRRQQFGNTQRLVSVSVRAWKPRTVQPRQRVEEAIDIV